MELSTIEVDKLIAEFDHSKSNEVLLTLSNILSQTKNHKIRDQIANTLAETGEPIVLNSLIHAIQSPHTQNHRGMLIYACEFFDCTAHLYFFTSLVVNGSYHEAFNAIDVIGNMQGPFKSSDVAKCLELVNGTTFNKENVEFIEVLKRFFSELE